MKRTGFTLVEILIVVIILGILAAIVVPQFTDASNEAKMSSLKSDLQTARGQIELYKMQHNGQIPSRDAADLAVDFWTQMTTMTDQDGAAGGTLGPYLQIPPTNQYRDSSAVVVGNPVADDGASGWGFDEGTGKFIAFGTAPDLDGDGVDEDLTIY